MSSARKLSLLRGLLGRVQRNRSKPRLANRSPANSSLASKNDTAVSQVPMPSSLPQPPADKDWHGMSSEQPAPPPKPLDSTTTGPEAFLQRTEPQKQQVPTPTSSDSAMEAYTAMAPVQSASPTTDVLDEVTAGFEPSAALPGVGEAEVSSSTSPDNSTPRTDTSPTMTHATALEGEHDTDRIVIESMTDVERQAPSAMQAESDLGSSVEDAIFQTLEPSSDPIVPSSLNGPDSAFEQTLKTQPVRSDITERSADSASRAQVELKRPAAPQAAPVLPAVAIAPLCVMPTRLKGDGVGDFIGAVEKSEELRSFGAILGASLDLRLDD